MSNYFIFHWPCGKCQSGATVDNPNGKFAKADAQDVLNAIRTGQRISYQRDGSVALSRCQCSSQETGTAPPNGWQINVVLCECGRPIPASDEACSVCATTRSNREAE